MRSDGCCTRPRIFFAVGPCLPALGLVDWVCSTPLLGSARLPGRDELAGTSVPTTVHRRHHRPGRGEEPVCTTAEDSKRSLSADWPSGRSSASTLDNGTNTLALRLFWLVCNYLLLTCRCVADTDLNDSHLQHLCHIEWRAIGALPQLCAVTGTLESNVDTNPIAASTIDAQDRKSAAWASRLVSAQIPIPHDS